MEYKQKPDEPSSERNIYDPKTEASLMQAACIWVLVLSIQLLCVF